MARLSRRGRPANELLRLVAALILGGGLPAALPAGEPALAFQKDIAPLLENRCGKCHGAGRRKGGLDLRRRFTILRGGDSGPAIVPGEPDESLLIDVVEAGEMPPPGEPPLGDGQAALLRRWVALGAPTAGRETPLSGGDAGDPNAWLDPAARQHWSFQPLSPVDPPTVERGGWLRSPVDAFVLARLQQQGRRPEPAASRGELIRRLCFDLTGLPPTPEQVRQFQQDRSPGAYQRLVDRLLASPAYGERWAQHWLDVVRYAETEGFEYDRHLPDAWRYRDYVIDALNEDKPFDRFVTEQLAGDELADAQPAARRELLAAAVFHRLGPVRRNAGNPDIALSRNEVLTERTDIIGEALLGLTVGCARCHDHKLEPISQKDYYRLQAYLAATQEHNVALDPRRQRQWDADNERIAGEIAALKKRSARADDARQQRLQERIRELERQIPPRPPTIPSIRNAMDARTEVHVLRRGVWEQKGAAVGPRPPSVLAPADLAELPADVGSPRTRLARWLVRPDHPLTARVIVNRLWQHHFGVGLVKTPNNFGTHGEPPSHPQLLDWLAARLVAGRWQLKPLQRTIVLSAAYRQRTRPASEARGEDPENRLLGGFSRRRLSAEEIRDAMLAAAGRLNRQLGGASVMVPVDRQQIDLLYKPSQWKAAESPAEHSRRSVYLIAKRNLRLPLLDAFDAPRLQTSCPRRESSTHAHQALELTNGRFANAMAEALAARLQRECGGDRERIVDRAFRLALGRPPGGRERELSLQFLARQPLREFALAMFNLNEFVYVR